MNGELVSGGRENLRVLIDYKGSGFPGGQMQDDLLLFSLRPDASPNPLALAVVNFPPIRGRRSLYIHRLSGEAPEPTKQNLRFCLVLAMTSERR